MKKREYTITLSKRCKETLFIKKHKCIEYPGLGFRCKYCGTPHATLLAREMPQISLAHIGRK